MPGSFTLDIPRAGTQIEAARKTSLTRAVAAGVAAEVKAAAFNPAA